MEEASESGDLRNEDLHARLDQLEDIVRKLAGDTGFADYGRNLAVAHDRSDNAGTAARGFGQPSANLGALSSVRNPEERIKPRSFTHGRARLVRHAIRQRRQREHYFPADLFADPAWDMMLDLYAAHYEGQVISVSSLCIAAAVPATTALRWIKTMVDDGRFLRSNDPFDGRRIIVMLSDDTRCRLDQYFDNLDD
ncbi:hypothetical protein [Sphingopyxis sp. R3-92]|uniref:hypothetical protein n=1 Tax=Sphingopyxis sp. R3-92 TaxID=3158553 RepID=UPI003EE455A3